MSDEREPPPAGEGGPLDRTEQRLRALDDTPVDEHVPIYDAVQRDLDEALRSGHPTDHTDDTGDTGDTYSPAG